MYKCSKDDVNNIVLQNYDLPFGFTNPLNKSSFLLTHDRSVM